MKQSILLFATLATLFALWAFEGVFGLGTLDNVCLPDTLVCSHDTVTFSKVKPIFKDRCSKCHYGIHKDWTDYKTAHTYQDAIKTQVCLLKFMPPRGEPMTEEDRDTIRTWIDGGAKQ